MLARAWNSWAWWTTSIKIADNGARNAPKCLECVVNMEAKIKLEGKWEQYERAIVKANALASLVDFEKAVDSWYAEKESFVSESGEVENWQGGDKTKMYEEIKTRLQEMKNTDIY